MPDAPRDVHRAGARAANGEHRDAVVREDRDGRGAGLQRRAQVHRQHRAAPSRSGRLLRREDAVDGDVVARGLRRQAAGQPDQVAKTFVGPQLVHRGAGDLARDLDARPTHRHEHDVTAVEPQLGGGDPVQEVVVEIDRSHELAPPPDLQDPEVSPFGDPAGLVQGAHDAAGRRDPIRSGAGHLAHHADRDGSHPRYGDVEPGLGIRPSGDAGVDPVQSVVEQLTELAQAHVAHEHLAHVRNDDEPLAAHLEGVGDFHLAREDQHQAVTGPQQVTGVDRARGQGLILSARLAKRLEPEELEARSQARGQVGPDDGIDAERVPRQPCRDRVWRKRQGILAQELGEAQRARRLRRDLTGCRRKGIPSEVPIQQVRGVAGGAETRADLFRRESRGQQALA